MHISFTYESVVHYIQTGVDILIVWILLSYLIKIVRNNQRTIQLFQGIIFIIIIQVIANYLGLTTVAWLTNTIVSMGFLAIIVIFQPEIRSILERLGKNNALARITVLTSGEKENLINELIAATATLSASKTGALITLEQSHSLADYIETGVRMNSLVSAELLCSIFQTTTPLHDGAIIIQGDKIACASTYFPPTSSNLSAKYGARHRAAIGISEITDAFTIVVSEENGRVSVTYQGNIVPMNEKKLREFLDHIILNKEVVRGKSNKAAGSQSVSVEQFLKLGADKEGEFKDESASSTHRQMKTFGQTDFTKVDEDDLKDDTQAIKLTQMDVKKDVRRVVNDVVNNANKPKEEEKPQPRKKESADIEKTQSFKPVTFRTVSVPKDTITEVSKPTIKTSNIVTGMTESIKVIENQQEEK